MPEGRFTFEGLLSRSWKTFLVYAGSFVGATVVHFIIMLSASAVYSGLTRGRWEIFPMEFMQADYSDLTQFMEILSSQPFPLPELILSGPFALGFAIMALRALHGQPLSVLTVFEGFRRFPQAFAAHALISIATQIGLLLCILPGLLIQILYLPVFLYMADRQLGFWGAMESSRRTVQSNLLQWITLGIMCVLVLGAGLLMCGIGILLALPFVKIIVAFAYAESEGFWDSADESDSQFDADPQWPRQDQ